MIKKRLALGITLVLGTILLTGCIFNKEIETEIIESDIDKRLSEEEKSKKPSISTLNGLEIDEKDIGKRPIAVMIDNHNRARWQSGLQKAELVYEFRVEGIYTRYMAFYLNNIPEKIGPVRSARPYFVTKALEMDAVYVHVGGSVQAKNDIKSLGIADIDGLYTPKGIFWRESHKRAPNNLYTDMDSLNKEWERNGYRERTEKEYFKFNDKDMDINGISCNEILISYLKPNTTKYVYDEESKNYIRYKDGKEHLEEIDKRPIRVKNIIIQEAATTEVDNEGRLSVDLIGKGQGKYITNGKIMDINWIKDSKMGKTTYMKDNGEELNLNPGNTWIQIVDLNPDIEIIS